MSENENVRIVSEAEAAEHEAQGQHVLRVSEIIETFTDPNNAQRPLYYRTQDKTILDVSGNPVTDECELAIIEGFFVEKIGQRNFLENRPTGEIELKTKQFSMPKDMYRLTDKVAADIVGAPWDEWVSVDSTESKFLLSEKPEGIQPELRRILKEANISVSKSIDEFDIEVIAAAYTLQRAGAKAVTTEQFLRVMHINERSEDNKKSLEQHFAKQGSTWIEIDVTDEPFIKREGASGGERIVIKGTFFPVRGISAEQGGKAVTAWDISGRIPLCYCAEIQEHITKYPASLHTMPKEPIRGLKLSSTEKQSDLTKKLAMRIASMKNKKSKMGKSKRIQYSWIFENTRLNTRRKADEMRRIHATLDLFKQRGYIKGWREYKRAGNDEAVGVEIWVKPEA